MDDIKLLIKGNEKNTFSIHYSCDGFYYGGAVAPSICTIALCNIKTNELHTFALHNYICGGKCLIDAERQLLTDFVGYFKSLKNPILIHWSMNGLEYGFKAISARCENYGIYDLDFGNVQTVDFSDCIYDSLLKALLRNNCGSTNLLDGKQESVCFDKRNYNAVKLSTEAKSKGIAKLINLALQNDWMLNNDDEEDYD